MITRFSYCFVVILLVALSACVTKKTTATEVEKDFLNTSGISSVSKKESKAQYKFIKAEGLYILEEYENALVSLDTVLVYSPENHVVYFKKSQCYEKLADLDNAVVYAKKSIKGNPRNEAYYRHLARIYEEEKEYIKSISVYEDLIREVPSATSAYADIAENYALLSNENEFKYNFHRTKDTELDKRLTTDALKKITKYDSETVKAWSLYGKSYELNDNEFISKQNLLCKLNRENEALIESIERVKNGHPEMLWKHVNLLLKVRNADEAIGFVKSYDTKTVEDELEKHRILGILYFLNEEPELALKEFKIVLSKNVAESLKSNAFLSLLNTDVKSDDIVRLGNLLSEEHKNASSFLLETEGDLYAHKSFDLGKAESAYKLALKDSPGDEDILAKLIKLKSKKKDYDALLIYADELLKTGALNLNIYELIAEAYLKKNKTQDAISTLHNGLKEVDNNYKLENEFYGSLASIHEEIGNYDSLYYYLEKSLEYNINDGELINNYLHRILKYGGDLDVARANGERLIRLYPKSPDYHKTYAQVMFKLEQYERAMAYIEKSIELGETSKDAYQLAVDYAEKNGDLVKAELFRRKIKTMDESE